MCIIDISLFLQQIYINVSHKTVNMVKNLQISLVMEPKQWKCLPQYFQYSRKITSVYLSQTVHNTDLQDLILCDVNV
jgi:hypothetical protein